MVSGVICFVAENPVRAVASTTITWLSKWYKEVSVSFCLSRLQRNRKSIGFNRR